MSTILELVQLFQNLLFDAFQFLVLEDFIFVAVVVVVVTIVAIVQVTGTASSGSAATWSAVPLVSPLV